MKTKLRDLFGTVWLPVYLLIGLSWLLAPALAHEHYGILRLISIEEAAKGSDEWFRVCDIVSAVLLLSAVFIFKVGRHARWFGWAVVLAAVLAAIDGLFPDTCYIGHTACGGAALGISTVHDVETVLLAALVGGISIFDAIRQHRAASIGFVALQLAAVFLVVSGIASPQFRVLLQYAYETALIIWLGWLVDRYNPVSPTLGHEKAVRQVLGIWVVLGGVFALITAIPHVDFIADWAGRYHLSYGLLLEQHGIITGILMLYLARHLLRGERPALWLATLLFYSQIIKYGVLTPQPAGLIVYAFLLALLIYTRHGFDRNTEPPSWVSRFEDIGVVIGGLVMAVVLLIAVVTLAGGRSRFLRDVSGAYNRPIQAFNRHEEHLSERREARLRTLSETLAISIGVVAVWSLFRPKAFRSRPEYHLTREQFERLLKRYAVNSEDFFKLWPADKAYFCPPGLTGAIAYRVEGGTAFMLADPIAQSNREREQLLSAFAAFVRQHGWVLGVLLIGGVDTRPYEKLGLQVIPIGSSAVIEVGTFNTKTTHDKWWRWQRNRANRNGWSYEKMLPPFDESTMQALKSVSDEWVLDGRKTEQGFALGYYDEPYLQQCTLHVLRDSEKRIIAFANELPIFGRVKRASVDLIRHRSEVDGAMPVLLMYIIGSLENTTSHEFDLGFVPLAKLDSELAKLVRRIGQGRFSAAGLEQFKNKFDPEWRPDYMAYDGDLIDLARIAANLESLLKVEKKD